MADTELVLTGIGIPDFSARGLVETLRPISGPEPRRTVNGVLIDVSDTVFRKYRLSLTGTDQEPPAFDENWIGSTVTVDALTKLAYLTSAGPAGRTVVPGSSVANGLFTNYRPRLVMLVMDWRSGREEYPANLPWTLELEEV
jgi:hypothetical protein